MTFVARETSRTRGAPLTLYRFSWQERVFAYTDAEQPITFAGTTYAPIPIQRGTIVASGTLDKSKMSINVPHDTEIADLFKVSPPSSVVAVTLFQGHEADGEFLAVWTGRVLSCGREKTQANLTCEPVSTSMRRPGLRRRYQYGCPHALYGDKCKANRAAFTVTTTPTGVSGATIAFAGGWQGAFDKANFLGGLAEWETDEGVELRTIQRVDADANLILLNGKVGGLLPGTVIKLSLGCDHQMTGCAVFANLPNYGGQPWIPTKNPLGFVSQYY